MPNVFTALGKYAFRQQETSLPKGWPFYSICLGLREPKALSDFLALLGGAGLELDTDNVVISTQESTDPGRPDLVITQKTDFTFFIEIKHDSSLGHQQLERYFAKLAERHSNIKHLVLLTRSKHSMRQTAMEKEKYIHLCWYQVSRWLANSKFRDNTAQYLAESYASFLEEKSMSLVKVRREFTSGIIAMRHLRNMMEIALLEVLPDEPLTKTDPWDSIGFYWTEGKTGWGFITATQAKYGWRKVALKRRVLK